MEYLERTFSFLTKNVKGHDAKLLHKGPAFAPFPEPTITVTSPDCGPSSSKMDVDHTQDGKDLLPTLTWSLPDSVDPSSVKEYLVFIEDADVPIPTPIMHAAYYNIPPTKTSISHEDLEKTGKPNECKGGFKYAKNLRGTVYSGPKPLRGHGPHRYFYQVVALSGPLDNLRVPAQKTDIVQGIQGKVLGWGQWIGVAERN